MSPFAGLRVVDLSPNRVGAQVSQVFADFGADVIQIEPPGGATIRRHAAYPFWARGKRSIVLDFHVDTDRDAIHALMTSADIVVETFSPGVLNSLGLGYDAIRTVNPRVIYTSVTGFGRQGPMKDAPGYDGLVQAKIGSFHAFRRMSAASAPPFVSAPFASFAASQVAIHGTLAALIAREKSGVGEWVEANLLHSYFTLDTWAWFEYLIAHRWPEAFKQSAAFDEMGRPASPLTFMLLIALTSDGSWLQFAAVAPHLFAAKMKALGLDWMFADPAWKGLPMLPEAQQRDDLWSKMLEAAHGKTLPEWHAIFNADDNVFAEEYRNGGRILEHPQLLHDAMVLDIVDAERGPVTQPGAIVKAAQTPANLGVSAPRLDEHRDAILGEITSGRSAATSNAVAATAEPKLPLAGITILELATLFAAPHGTTMLTDLGARVFKIEPLAGDRIRNIVPFPECGGAKVMQGKESIAVDITTPEGLAIVKEIAARVDVVVQGYRAGAMHRAGLDYESIRATNPKVVYVNAPGYGVDGPYGAKPAYAPSIGAAVGIPLVNAGGAIPWGSTMSTPEMKEAARRLSAAGTVSNAQADGFAALGVASAVLIGLAARARGNGGQELFSSMINTGAHAMSAHAIVYPGCPIEPSVDREFRGLGPLYRVYDASEGYVFLAAVSNNDWTRLVDALGSEAGLAGDNRFASATLREQNADALATALASVFATKSAATWEKELLAKGVGCVKVHTDLIESQMYDDSFGRASGYVADAIHPTFEEHIRLAPFVRFSRSLTQAKPGVLAGQQTDAILTELGRSADDIASLRERKVVG